MKTLSGANQTNIAGTFHDADVLVEMTGISKQWSTKTRTSYETRILDISSIRQAVSAVGGIAEMSDFSVTLQVETPSQFIQDEESDNETVDLYLQYGTDAKIPLISGRLDRWELAPGSKLILHCVAELETAGANLPLQQVTADIFSIYFPFDVPTANVGKWVPVTFGAHDRALGLMVDRTPGAQRIVFNAEPGAPDAIHALNQLYVWMSQSREFVKVLTTWATTTNGWIAYSSDVAGSADNGFVELTIIAFPIEVTWLVTAWTNPEYAMDRDCATYAYIEDSATPPGTQSSALYCLIRDLPFPESVTVLEDRLFFLGDCERTAGGNIDSANGEDFVAGIELEYGVGLPAAAYRVDVIPNGDSDFDNLNDMDDAETDLPFDTSDYAAVIGIDTDGDATAETLPVHKIGGRHFVVRYVEYQPPGGTNKKMEVREVRLRIDAKAEAETQDYYADIEGYEDVLAGTYTGTAYALIENPADVLYFMLDNLLGFSSIDTTAISTARTALGDYALAGQVLELTPALEILDRIARQGKLKLFRDANDEWSCKAYTVPSTADIIFDQADGDFVGDTDDGMEGEIRSITQSPLDELYNQFEILYQWNQATRAFDSVLTLDESTSGPIGDWLTESQSRYNLTRKLTIECEWIRTADVALSFGNYLIYMYADRKRVVEWQTSWNGAAVEVGDRAQLNHVDVMLAEDTTVFAGYRAGDPLATIHAGYTDPDTSATIKAGAKVQLYEGRHQYEVNTIETLPMEGKIRFTGRQVDFSRSPLSEPF